MYNAFLQRKILILLCVIIIAGVFVRLYRFDNPIGDWHSWRQADTSAVSRSFVTSGFDLLHPRFEDLSNIPSGKDNPNGYRFVEFPLYNIAQAGLFKLIGGFTLEEWGRLVTIFASSLATLFLYLIVSRHSNRTIGLLTAFFYAFIPYNIYYGRTILPDPSMVTAILGGIYFFDRYVGVIARSETTKSKIPEWGQSDKDLRLPRSFFARNDGLFWFFLALLLTVSAFLLKPYALFFTLPMLVLAYNQWGLRLLAKWQLWVFAIISVLPLILWRQWITQYPEGIPVNAWLLNGNGIRFRPAFFKWILYERLTKLISGYLGIFVFLFGLYWARKLKEWLFFASFLVSSLLYVVVFATGNVQHDYYQILIMPSVAIFFAIGSYFLYSWSVRKIPLGKVILVVSIGGLFWFGWYQVKDYFNINNPDMVIAGQVVDQLTPKNAKIIAFIPGQAGDTSFLYQTQRQGWPSFEKPIPEMVQMGASYLVLLDPTKQDLGFSKTYRIVKATPQYVIFKLTTVIHE